MNNTIVNVMHAFGKPTMMVLQIFSEKTVLSKIIMTSFTWLRYLVVCVSVRIRILTQQLHKRCIYFPCFSVKHLNTQKYISSRGKTV